MRCVAGTLQFGLKHIHTDLFAYGCGVGIDAPDAIDATCAMGRATRLAAGNSFAPRSSPLMFNDVLLREAQTKRPGNLLAT